MIAGLQYHALMAAARLAARASEHCDYLAIECEHTVGMGSRAVTLDRWANRLDAEVVRLALLAHDAAEVAECATVVLVYSLAARLKHHTVLAWAGRRAANAYARYMNRCEAVQNLIDGTPDTAPLNAWSAK